MNKKTMQIVIVVVCLLLAAVVLAYALGFIGSSGPAVPVEPGEDAPRMAAPPDSGGE